MSHHRLFPLPAPGAPRRLNGFRPLEMTPPDSRMPAGTGLFSVLTPAEKAVALLVVQGLSNKEISSVLARAEPTIKHQVASLLGRTGMVSRARFIAGYYRQFLNLDAARLRPAGLRMVAG